MEGAVGLVKGQGLARMDAGHRLVDPWVLSHWSRVKMMTWAIWLSARWQ